MHSFTNVRNTLKDWLSGYAWINVMMPYHLHILFGGVGLMFLHELIYYTFKYVHIFYLLSAIGYWAFILGLLLTLISKSVKYMPYAIWAYVFEILFPFKSFSFGILLNSTVYLLLGILAFKYSAVETEEGVPAS